MHICVRIPTIGWGHTEDVKLGDKITQKEADRLLKDDLVIYENVVSRLVKVELNQDMFDAMVSFTYNAGSEIYLSQHCLNY